ncbi:MAG: V-type ATPase subunit [Phycisphaerae bacterium]
MSVNIDSIGPRVGRDEWDYGFQAALVRSMETTFITEANFADMAAAQDVREAIDCISTSTYRFAATDSASVETTLLEARSALRSFFRETARGTAIEGLPEIEADMSNLRLAVRRFAAGRNIGDDYGTEGSVRAEEFERIFESDDYCDLPAHFRDALESALLLYYDTKDIRSIDLAIDAVEFARTAALAADAELVFLADINRVRVDLVNIGMLLRVKYAGSEEEPPFIEGGFVDIDKLRGALYQSFDVFDQVFYSTIYEVLVVSSVHYLMDNDSFVRFEALCERFLSTCCKLSSSVTAGLQPLIAYYYCKQLEIRRLRIVLSAKRNGLDSKLIAERLGV